MLNWLRALLLGESVILNRLDRIERLIMSNQDKLNEVDARLGTLSTDLRGDIDGLKAQIAAGTAPEDLDFSSVDARLDALDALDAETPAASAAPVDGVPDENPGV